MSDSSQEEEMEINIFDLIVYREDSPFVRYWKMVHVVCCVISSYMYGYLAAFGFDKDESVKSNA